MPVSSFALRYGLYAGIQWIDEHPFEVFENLGCIWLFFQLCGIWKSCIKDGIGLWILCRSDLNSLLFEASKETMDLGWDPQIPVLTSSEYGIDESFPSVYYVILGLQKF